MNLYTDSTLVEMHICTRKHSRKPSTINPNFQKVFCLPMMFIQETCLLLIELFLKRQSSFLNFQHKKCVLKAQRISLSFYQLSVSYQKDREQWVVFYTSPQSFLTRWPSNFGDQYWLVNEDGYPNVSTTNCNLQKGQLCKSTLGMYIDLSAIVLSLQIPRLYVAHILLILCLHVLWGCTNPPP